MTGRGLYLHVPLCASKCLYCDFYSLPVTEDVADKYLEAVVQEIVLRGEMWGGRIQTVYFGGGTPSCLSLTQVATILKECSRFFTWGRDCEVTFEVNPNRLGLDYLRGLKSLGVTRLSVGLQAIQPQHLVLLRRRHTARDFYCLCEDIRCAGFDNYSIDALYGFPEQTLADYVHTLQAIVASGAKHVSAYALQLEPHTPLAHAVAEGILSIPEEDEVADMMLAGRDYLVAQGFSHYELSNFAAPAFESRHNSLYWRNEEYIGLGPGAASYIAERRCSNVADLDRYAYTLGQGCLPVYYCERLEPARQMGETMMLGLRMLQEGVNRGRFVERFGCDCVDVYSQIVERLVRHRLLEVTPQAVRLTAAGFPLASQIQMQFLT